MTHADTAPTPHRTAPDRRGWRRFGLGMAAYVALVLLQGFLLRPADLPLALVVPLALLPMVPALWAMSGWLLAVRSMDELNRRIAGEAGLIALGVTAVATFSYGFLEIYTPLPTASMFWVWPLIAVSYGAAAPLVRRRYR